jgi:3-oxoacyl-[acyl-carrier protein] reductase
MKLKDKCALVTGGSEGIGYGIAKALIARGARVGIMARDETKLKKAAGELGAEPFTGDVGREEDAIRVVKSFVERFGGIDILALEYRTRIA